MKPKDPASYASSIASCERGQQVEKASILLAELKRTVFSPVGEFSFAQVEMQAL